MTKKILLEVLRRIAKKAIAENAPATAPTKPQQEPGTKERPTTPQEPKKPRRTVGDPGKKPDTIPVKATGNKASMNEDETMKKIVARYKAGKK